MTDVLINHVGWVEVPTKAVPKSNPLSKPRWSDRDAAILKAMFRPYGRQVAAWAVRRDRARVDNKISNMGLRRFPRPCADKRGGVA